MIPRGGVGWRHPISRTALSRPSLLSDAYCSAMRRLHVGCKGMFVLYTITHMSELTRNTHNCTYPTSVLQIADQLLERVDTLHTRHLIHRDIKPVSTHVDCTALCCRVLSCPSLRLHYSLPIHSHLPSSHVASLHMHFSLSTPSLLFPLIYFPPYILLPLMSL